MKDIIEKINVVDALVVILVGGALIASVVVGRDDISLAAVTGLVGYLGGHGAATITQTSKE